jgi:cell division protein YceG involved in septum cleavage
MGKDHKKSSGYDITVSGMKGIVRILVLICIVIALFFVGGEAYQLGYHVFNQTVVDKGEGREIKVTVKENMSVAEIGEMLRNVGLLKEDTLVFRIQELVSDYHGKLQPGTYTLRTGMTADEMLRVMAGEDKDNQTGGKAK